MAKQVKLSKSESDDDAFNDMYGSNWLSPDDIKKPFTTTIEAWERQTFSGPGGKEKDKVVLTLKEVKKPCVCNKTNVLNLSTEYAKNFDRWIGKPVLVKTEMTSFQGKPTKGVRLYPVDPNDMKGDSITF
jgi:hypothetical protein